jgi:CTP synthase (UTP-ammonia lyase)
MNHVLRIGIIGDWNADLPSHVATDAALSHAAQVLATAVESTWLPTKQLAEASSRAVLLQFDGLWCSSGGPYESSDGALSAVQFAREEGWPFIGT